MSSINEWQSIVLQLEDGVQDYMPIIACPPTALLAMRQ